MSKFPLPFLSLKKRGIKEGLAPIAYFAKKSI